MSKTGGDSKNKRRRLLSALSGWSIFKQLPVSVGREMWERDKAESVKQNKTLSPKPWSDFT